MVKVVVDSSVIIEYLRTKRGVFVELAGLYAEREIDLLVPTIVIFELWRGRSMSRKSVRVKVAELVSEYDLVALTREIAVRAGEIERKMLSEGNDALIAATCLSKKAKLATLNVKDFDKVADLELWKS